MTGPQDTTESDADDVGRHDCPRCGVQPGSPCRSRSGAVAGIYHTGRFKEVARLAKLLRVPAPADRGPGQPWRPGTPPPAAPETDNPGADIRIGYARCSRLTQELQSQLEALSAHGIPGTRSSPRRSAPASGSAPSSRPLTPWPAKSGPTRRTAACCSPSTR
ncbi:zinc finger domain-containing protein [Streptomyces shenzhenensis]|uniref:zinc finger domain-containing protein n=1 Tax=Streptomyces shenzhenensis TaxID=943815 RepID=UPI001F1E5C7D|nr:hypothetical protein [Streptomyces shenzhenensis]